MLVLFYQILFLILAYFIAAIPFGLIITKLFAGIDVREGGSKNIGATNVVRLAGKKLGLVTLLLDGAKGAVMVIAARFLFQDTSFLHSYLSLVALTCVVAHIYPIYLNFKGGKGVATAIAVLLALDLNVGLAAIIVWALSFLICRISSVSSLLAIFSAAIYSMVYFESLAQVIFSIILFALISYRHKENILRLKNGEEKKSK
jgi:glycerol-3-phosphate acyltransferase PlsY